LETSEWDEAREMKQKVVMEDSEEVGVQVVAWRE